MDRLETYRNAVKTFLKQYADLINQCPQPGKELEEMDISKKEIMVGFHPPLMHQYSDYGTA